VTRLDEPLGITVAGCVAMAALAVVGGFAAGRPGLGVAFAAGALLGAANGFLARLALRAEVDFRVTSAGRLALMTTVALAVGALLGWIYTPFVLGGVGASQLLLAGAAAFTAVRTAQR